jgi:hypothetical protein
VTMPDCQAVLAGDAGSRSDVGEGQQGTAGQELLVDVGVGGDA